MVIRRVATADPIKPGPVFSTAALATITAWGAARPHGLRIDVAGEHAEFVNVAEVFGRDRACPLYSITPLLSGGFEINPVGGRRRDFRAVVGGADVVVHGVGEALALIEHVERFALGLDE